MGWASALVVSRPLLCPLAANPGFERMVVVISSSWGGLLLLRAMRETIDSSKFTEKGLSLRLSEARRWIPCQTATGANLVHDDQSFGRQYQQPQQPRSDSKTGAFLFRCSWQQLVSSSTMRFHVREALTGCKQFINRGGPRPRPHS